MTPLARSTIQVTIVYDSRRKSEECEAGCGIDWLSAEATALASQRVEERFGSAVELDYLDLSKARTNHRALELKQAVENKNLPLPLLLINGQTRISGQFDIRLLLDAIDAEIEIKSK